MNICDRRLRWAAGGQQEGSTISGCTHFTGDVSLKKQKATKINIQFFHVYGATRYAVSCFECVGCSSWWCLNYVDFIVEIEVKPSLSKESN